MFRRFLTPLFTLILALGITSSALAQSSYLFSVPKNTVDVYWNSDGTESIEYTMEFVNQPGAHPIDFVDIGTPNSNFDIANVSADLNGNQVSVSQSDYQGSGSGFAVVLGGQEIAAGAGGSVHVLINNMSGVLYPDSSDSKYASGVFSPTYFGSQYVSGSTDMTVTFHLPPGVQSTEPRWHDAPSGFPAQPQTGIDANGRVTYQWQSLSANISSQYQFGASFPASYVPASAIVTTSVFDLLFGAIATLFSFVSSSLPCLCFAAFFVGLPAVNAYAARRRKFQYLPPKVSIEGHGIKRGLTAIEAAILMEQPLDKIMTMILFGVIKKNAAEVVTHDPLTLSFAKEQPADLHQYEIDFLQAFKELDTTKRQRALQETMVSLVRSVSEKMRGFSRKETLDYYKSIMEKAWQQIEAAGTPEVKSQKLDETLEWTMLDKNYDERTRRAFNGPVFVPMWWGRYNPTYSSSPVQTGSGLPTSMPSQPSGRSALPGADFAAQMVTGVQTFSSKVVGNVNTFTEKITGATNPPPKPTSTGGGGGRSGGGCACACACAGCACACAGGGR